MAEVWFVVRWAFPSRRKNFESLDMGFVVSMAAGPDPLCRSSEPPRKTNKQLVPKLGETVKMLIMFLPVFSRGIEFVDRKGNSSHVKNAASMILALSIGVLS